jgi:hypothetical protein
VPPITRLKAVLKALSDSYPTERATAPTGSPRDRLRPASSIRQRVRYSIGPSPTNCPNRAAKPDRDMPTSSASAATVQRRAGSRWIAAIAAPTCLSESANSQPPPLPSSRWRRSGALDEDHVGELLYDQDASRLGIEPESSGGTELAHCRPIILINVRELHDQAKGARLWWAFKRAIEKTPGAILEPGDRFGVRLNLSAPAYWQQNLADVVKPLMDGFISVLHSYAGDHRDVVGERIAPLLREPVPQVRDLLLDDGNTPLGPRAVPYLRGKGLQWSPADDLLIVGEVCREISAEDQLAIHRCLFKPA